MWIILVLVSWFQAYVGYITEVLQIRFPLLEVVIWNNELYIALQITVSFQNYMGTLALPCTSHQTDIAMLIFMNLNA